MTYLSPQETIDALRAQLAACDKERIKCLELITAIGERDRWRRAEMNKLRSQIRQQGAET